MTLTLQNALIMVGALLVLAVYLLSRRQYPRAGKTRAERGAATGAPFMNELESEYEAQNEDEDFVPAASEDDESAAQVAHAQTESPLADAQTPPMQPAPQSASQSASQNMDGKFHARLIEGFERISQIDYWVKISGARDVGRESVLAIFHENAGDFTMPRSIHGVRMPQKEWCDLVEETEGSRFGDLVVTIQLADRNGAISAEEMAKFSELVSRLSEGTGREFFFMAPVENAIAQARVVADFIAHFDTQFSLSVRPREAAAFSGEEIQRCARELGLESGARRYCKFKSAGKKKAALYDLADGDARGGFDFDRMEFFSARELIFSTKPALNQSPGAVFAEMAAAAKEFAACIDGVIDDGGEDSQELPQRMIDARRADIERIAAEMAEFGIPAGCEEAVKIF